MQTSSDIKAWEAARARWERGVAVESTRAKAAVIALALTAALRAMELGATALHASFVPLLVDLEIALLVATAVVFLRWLAHAVTLAGTMSVARIKWTSSAAVWSFFFPILSLWRPFVVIRDLSAQLAPDGVPEPAPRPRLDGSGGYRQVAMEAAPTPRALPVASIGAWWALFVAARLLGFGGGGEASEAIFADGLSIASALLGVLVVRAIDGRVAERWRRLRHASDEELERWEVRG